MDGMTFPDGAVDERSTLRCLGRAQLLQLSRALVRAGVRFGHG
jgi:hypothetical protein